MSELQVQKADNTSVIQKAIDAAKSKGEKIAEVVSDAAHKLLPSNKTDENEQQEVQFEDNEQAEKTTVHHGWQGTLEMKQAQSAYMKAVQELNIAQNDPNCDADTLAGLTENVKIAEAEYQALLELHETDAELQNANEEIQNIQDALDEDVESPQIKLS